MLSNALTTLPICIEVINHEFIGKCKRGYLKSILFCFVLTAWNLYATKQHFAIPRAWRKMSPRRGNWLSLRIVRGCSLMNFKWSGDALYVEHGSNIYTFATTSWPLPCLEMTRSLTSPWQNSFVTDCWLNSMVIFMKFQCIDCLTQLGCWWQTPRPYWL